MNKPNDWEETYAADGQSNDSTLPKGGYLCKVKTAKVEQTKTGKDVLVVAFDISDGEYKGFFQQKFDSDDRAEKKWRGIYRLILTKNDGKTNPFFKGFITSIEASNKGYMWNWEEKTLKDKVFGGLFSVEEYYGNDGQVRSTTKCNLAISVQKLNEGDYKLPQDYLIEKKENVSNSDNSGFYAVPNTEDYDDLPF